MPKIRQILASPQILQTPDGHHSLLVAATTPALVAARVKSAQGTRFLARGYQQTNVAAADGGIANTNGFRFRPGGVRALARTFRGQPFITGHDWGDVRARGGTIMDAYAEDLEGALQPTTAINYEIDAVADWAREGLANGTIDRFSLGVDGTGGIRCTVHDAPMWSMPECWCFPGELVSVTRKNDKGEDVVVELVAEWEWEGGIGLELSGVNVPAVGNTEVIEIYEDGGESETAVRAADLLAQVCGRARPRPDRRRVLAQVPLALDPEKFLGRPLTDEERAQFVSANTRLTAGAGVVGGGGARTGGFTPAPVATSMGGMTHEELCRLFELPVTATPAELAAKMTAAKQATAQVSALTDQLQASARDAQIAKDAAVAAEQAETAKQKAIADGKHVELALDKAKRERVIPTDVIAKLRITAATKGTAAFDEQLELVTASSAAAAPAIGDPRAKLQSDAAAIATPITAGADGAPAADGPDAFEANKENPYLGHFMKGCGLTAADVRKHGPKAQVVVPDLQSIINNSPS